MPFSSFYAFIAFIVFTAVRKSLFSFYFILNCLILRINLKRMKDISILVLIIKLELNFPSQCNSAIWLPHIHTPMLGLEKDE